MPSDKSKYCIRFFVDLILLISVIASIFLVKKLWPSFERGMFCNDLSLRYPFIEKDTITDSILLFYGAAVPIILMGLIEFIRIRKESVGKHVKLVGRKLSSWLWAVYSSVGVFLFGCACSQLFTDIAKYSLGFLRPHFIDVCKPDWNETDCATNPLAFVDPVPCTTDESDADKLKDARQSFPSGHASFSAFTMVYLVIYLQKRLDIQGFRLVKPILQIICLLLTFYTCLSRLSDYKHHWEDVIGGFLLGATVAVLIACFVSDLFRKKTYSVVKGQAVVLQDYLPGTEELNSSPTTMLH